MERSDVERWIDDYVAAWRSYDRDAIAALFTEDARYRYHPWDEGVTGRTAIVDDWLSERDDPERWSAEYRPFAVEGDAAAVVGRSTYTQPDGSVRKDYENCFLIRFGADGRCSEFTEFFMERSLTE